MKKIAVLCFISILSVCMLLNLSACGTNTGDLSGAVRTTDAAGNIYYNDVKVLFEDDFDFLDLTKWKINPIPDGIRRAAYHTEENVFVKDGSMVIRTEHKTSALGTGWHTGWAETSVNAKPGYDTAEGYTGFAATYGYYEIRAKAAWVPGAWFAFWMMPDEGVAFTDADIQNTAADGAEIDIMETNWTKNHTGHVIHYDGYNENLKSLNSGSKRVRGLHTGFHTYGFEWTKDAYIFYIDGVETWRTDEPGISAVNEYMLLTGEVAGYCEDGVMHPGKNKDGSTWWSGDVEKNSKDKTYDFVIDYVRVLERKP